MTKTDLVAYGHSEFTFKIT